MDRRSFIASITGMAASASIPAIISTPAIASGERMPRYIESPHPHLALPTADQLAWQDLEMGMFIHFAPNTWQGTEQDDLTTPCRRSILHC